ncbi:MAG: hypothetical protein COA62_05855 [Rhodobiaceae bacterium]|nr:MAG: hypothetical protein COA62_05855 [Rhodobiaceae bacterium]
MMSLGPLAFAAPWALLGLLSLPIIWWLLRVTPPAPKRVRFPAIRLLLELKPETEAAAHTPWWLLLLRLTIAALVVLAMANPLWRPAERLAGGGPLLILIDNGWASAPDWSHRVSLAKSLIDQAARANRRIAILATAPKAVPTSLHFEAVDEALSHLATLTPEPLSPERAEIVLQVGALEEKPSQIVWISDGLDYGFADPLVESLTSLGINVDLIEPADGQRAFALLPPTIGTGDITVPVLRASTSAVDQGSLASFAVDGRPLGRVNFAFEPGSLRTEATLSLPLELRNEIARISLDRQTTAGSTILLDERWRRRTLGMVSAENSDQPLLSDLYYLERALEPFVDVRKPHTLQDDESPIANLLSQPLSVLLLADLGRLAATDVELVSRWIKDGGVLVRFAGPRLAAQADPLIPVPLRAGGRELGGALSWSEPQHLAPFDPESPFAGITIPDDVTVTRQVLADPRGDLSANTWARLQDGTPLVTARSDGDGWMVLIHVTANTDWSNLALSGLYVDMLRRLIDLSQGSASSGNDVGAGAALAPKQMLDAYGRLGPTTPWATPIGRMDITSARPSALHPPGLYGDEGAARALNVTSAKTVLTPLPDLAGLTSRRIYAQGSEYTLKAPLLIIALLLLLADGVAALFLSGRLTRAQMTHAAPLAALAFFLIVAHPAPVLAEDINSDDAAALAAVLETHLAYVLTGDAEIDELSRAGLAGLSETLRRRTALEPGDPIGVNVEYDELTFFPLLYWPVSPAQPELSSAALVRVDAYMKQGGTILFDTRDQGRAIQGLTTEAGQTLRNLLAQLDIPPVEPVPATHVLTRAFYLLTDFPGRWSGGPLWVERTQARDGSTASSNDGVSAILIGSNDYAGAWALNASGRPLFAVVPGGERQREIAARVGVNLVMYALTGNYKADQVHLPALLERLGQ